VNGPRFLEIAVHAVEEHALGAGFDVGQVQNGPGCGPPQEGERLAIRGRGRANRAARAAGEALVFAGLAVEPLDGVDLAVRVLLYWKLEPGSRPGCSRRNARRARRPAPPGLLVVRPLVHLQAAAARTVVEPDFAGARRAGRGEVLARRDELPIGRPGRAVEQPEGLLRDRLGLLPIAIHHPMLSPPPRSLVKAMRLPSGDQRGCSSRRRRS